MSEVIEVWPGIRRSPRTGAARPPAGAPLAGTPPPSRRRVLLILPVTLALGACGQKGALFLPEEEGEEEEARAPSLPESTA